MAARSIRPRGGGGGAGAGGIQAGEGTAAPRRAGPAAAVRRGEPGSAPVASFCFPPGGRCGGIRAFSPRARERPRLSYRKHSVVEGAVWEYGVLGSGATFFSESYLCFSLFRE